MVLQHPQAPRCLWRCCCKIKITKKVLSGMIQVQHFGVFLHCPQSSLPVSGISSCFLLAISGPFSWFGLALESNEYRMVIKWLMGMDNSGCSMCPFCPDTAHDPLSQHAVTCRHGRDVVIHHNRLRDEIFDICRRAHLSVVARQSMCLVCFK